MSQFKFLVFLLVYSNALSAEWPLEIQGEHYVVSGDVTEYTLPQFPRNTYYKIDNLRLAVAAEPAKTFEVFTDFYQDRLTYELLDNLCGELGYMGFHSWGVQHYEDGLRFGAVISNPNDLELKFENVDTREHLKALGQLTDLTCNRY